MTRLRIRLAAWWLFRLQCASRDRVGQAADEAICKSLATKIESGP